MDPNANLQEQATLLDAMDRSDRRRLSELRHALQSWLTSGGFAPNWNTFPQATKAYKAWVRQSAKFQDLAR